MKAFTESDRPAILDLLKTAGGANAPALARALGVNVTAARQQLAVLQREGLVQVRVERRKVGRPTHLYALTAKAEALFPQAYGPFALTLLRQLRDHDGEKKIERLLEQRTQELLREYRRRTAGMNAGGKLKELARLRAEEGYMAVCSRGRLAEHHCPIAAIAAEFPQVCRFEKRLFEALLGLKLERTEHIASGGAACVYEKA
jgi:predicted ArsR family transcriptional regulator